MEKTLVVSISGIRGIVGRGIDPEVLVQYVSAYARYCWKQSTDRPKVVVGRDARISGELFAELTMGTLQAAGCDVIDAGMATTPTGEMAVLAAKATGGIVLSASHNPAEWNALKLLNAAGEFLSPTDAGALMADAENPAQENEWADVMALGSRTRQDFLEHHIDQILALPEINSEVVRRRDFRVLVDGVDSIGGVAIPALLERLGVRKDQIIRVNCEPTGHFSHPAEPLPENLVDTCRAVRDAGADIGLVVDPDADRLALIADGGVYVSEELTQVLAAMFWWKHHEGPFATNLSSSRTIEDVARDAGQDVFRSAVGEINVVGKMKEVGAVIGGEGNGGVILPALHYGRDALVGTALILQLMADEGLSMSELVARIPAYRMAKMKTPIAGSDPDTVLALMAEKYSDGRISTVDGVKIDFDDGWVHMRKSNTEPIIRVYAEALSEARAAEIGNRFMDELLETAASTIRKGP